MDKVLKELTQTIYVEDPCSYAFHKIIANSVIERRHYLVSFFEGSWASKNIDKEYWRPVNYDFLTKRKYGINLVWFEFIGKHIMIVN